MHRLSLVQDVLDAQLVDRHEEKIGRVDGVLLELRDGEPPRVATILIGGAIRGERIGRWMSWLRRTIRAITRRGDERVSRVPFDAVRRVGDTVQLDVESATLPSGHLERWLAEHVVCHIPGGAGERK
jgi:hypothetical protein